MVRYELLAKISQTLDLYADDTNVAAAQSGVAS
jgi:hypothetical protein